MFRQNVTQRDAVGIAKTINLSLSKGTFGRENFIKVSAQYSGDKGGQLITVNVIQTEPMSPDTYIYYYNGVNTDAAHIGDLTEVMELFNSKIEELGEPDCWGNKELYEELDS